MSVELENRFCKKALELRDQNILCWFEENGVEFRIPNQDSNLEI